MFSSRKLIFRDWLKVRRKEKPVREKKKTRKIHGGEWTPRINPVKMDADAVKESIRNHVDVSLKLANQVFSTVTTTESNLVFSPLSINVILALLAAGSNGRTLNELLAFLSSKSADDLHAFYSQVLSAVFSDGSHLGSPRLSAANGAWIQQTLPPLTASFKHVVENVYKAVSESVDFLNKGIEVVNHVNKWVEKETGGLIKQILTPDVNPNTLFILANALYFKGVWTEKFKTSHTEDYKFHLPKGSPVKVPFMCSWESQQVRAFDGFKVLRLPYEQGDDETRHFSMYIFLPDAKDGLPSLVHRVTSETGLLERCLTSLPKYPVRVGEFRIPKFNSSFHLQFSEVLKELGVVSPFDGGEGLSEMVDGGHRLHVTRIIHKSFIEVNEEGTEAAAATVALMGCGAGRWRPPPVLVDFVADHPFLYFIREDLTGAIVLFGTLINPLD